MSLERINAPYGEGGGQRARKEAREMRVALFDVGGTLIRGQSYAHLLRWLWRRGWRHARRR